MDPERWQRIKELFSTVLELPPGQRAAWLGSALPDDPALASEVEHLAAAHDGASDFYEQGAVAAIPGVRRQLEGKVEGTHLGPYLVVSELGRGGMGAVYLAIRDQPGFIQQVAIKLVKRGMDTDQIVRRFVAERQILASLAHPNIARLFDGGSTPDGLPYFVMEYVEGKPITAYAEEQKLSVEARLQLFLRVCRAVQHAHQSLVVHRDLKPANILVEAEGEPKLLDFGIAKILDPRSFGGVAAETGYAPGPMTPDYASPEQLAGGAITTATDVYGLGLLLYELLVGQNPRSVERKLGENWSERPPSQALSVLSEGDAEARRLARRVAGDIDTIVGKALELDPDRRYGTAAALAEDVERHLSQRPVAARRPTLAYRLSRTLVRHKLAAALVLAICLSLIVTSYLVYARGQERDRAEAQRQRAEALNDLFQGWIRKVNPEQSRGETLTLRQVLDAGSEDLLRQDSPYPPEALASLLEATGTTYENLGLYEKAKKNLQRALQLREALGDSTEEGELALAGTLSSLGSVSLRQEDFAEARNDFERALALRERRLGATDLLLAKDLNGLGEVFVEEGQIEEAARHFVRACSISRVEGGHRDLANCYNNLGSLAVQKGEFARAQFLFSAAFRYFQSNFGSEHPETTLVRSNLAFILNELGEYAGAEALSQEIVDVRRRLLEPGHPDLAEALLELAIIQRLGGELDKARATLDELLRMRRDHRFPRDENEAETWNLVGAIAYAAKDMKAADAAYAKSYEIYRTLPGDRRANLSDVLNGQALARFQNDPQGALALARRSLELARAAGVDSDYLVARAGIVLGHLYRTLGQPSVARPYLERSHKTFLDLYGPEHPATREAYSHLKHLGATDG